MITPEPLEIITKFSGCYQMFERADRLENGYCVVHGRWEGVSGVLGCMELSYPRTFVPGNKSSIGGTFIPWNFRSLTLIIILSFVILADHVWNYQLSNDEALPVAVWTFLLAHVYARNARRRRRPQNCDMTKTNRNSYLTLLSVVQTALGNESSRGRKFQGTKVPPMELSFPGTKVYRVWKFQLPCSSLLTVKVFYDPY